MSSSNGLVADNGDTSWMLTSSALVLIMTPGLGFFYGGLVGSKNVVNTMAMSFVTISVITIQFTLVGFSLAFGPGSPAMGDLQWGGLANVGVEPNAAYAATIPFIIFCLFQMMFAIITPAIISGSIAARMKFSSWVIFIVLWSIVVYDLVAHMVWAAYPVTTYDSTGNQTTTLEFGWLRGLGAIDFAGGTVVHMTSGFSALSAALILGPRKNWQMSAHRPANVPYVILGTALLWFGWYVVAAAYAGMRTRKRTSPGSFSGRRSRRREDVGSRRARRFGFNAGSALSATGDGTGPSASIAFATTQIATAAASVTWLALDSIFAKPSAVGACVGAVIGLVVITPAAGFVVPGYAILIGIAGTAWVYLCAQIKTRYLNRWLPADDVLDVFVCHGQGGAAGAFLTGCFATLSVNPAGANGAFYGNPILLGYQLVAILIVAVISLGFTAILLLGLKYTIGIRASDSAEDVGLDKHVHGETHLDDMDQLWDVVRGIKGSGGAGGASEVNIGSPHSTNVTDASKDEQDSTSNSIPPADATELTVVASTGSSAALF